MTTSMLVNGLKVGNSTAYCSVADRDKCKKTEEKLQSFIYIYIYIQAADCSFQCYLGNKVQNFISLCTPWCSRRAVANLLQTEIDLWSSDGPLAPLLFASLAAPSSDHVG